jgi:hypothetical protein
LQLLIQTSRGRLRTFKACKRHYYRHRPSTLKVAPSTAIEKSNALQALKSRRRTRLEYRANPTGGVDPQRKPVREPSASNDPANDPSLPVPVSGSAVHQDNLPSVGDDNFDFYGERLQELQKENKDHLERIRNLNNQFDEAKVQHNRMHAKLMSDIAALKRQFDMDIGSLLGGQRVPLNLEYMKEADDWQKTEAAIENFGIAFEDLHGYPSPWPILNDV